MASISTVPVQESLTPQVDYYDIMIIGHTGQGKSTTVDKLLIANPDKITYTVDDPCNLSEDSQKIECSDISLWMASNEKLATEGPVRSHFKSLIFARTTSEPHVMINQIRDSLNSDEARTTDCELYSNDTTKIRVLDVPGFFDEEAFSRTRDRDLFKSELLIMRKVLLVQARMDLKFKKILYLLPVRGALERAGAVIQHELQILMHFFGKNILKKLVLVVTKDDENGKLSERQREKTIKNFQKCLVILKAFASEMDVPPISLICIALGDSCESILKKVQEAKVIEEDLLLQLDSGVCQSCGKRVGFVKENKLVCYLDDEDRVPYDESTCHPQFVPDYHWYHKLAEGLTRLVTAGHVQSLANRFNLQEVCIGCRAGPGNKACMKVGETAFYNGQKITCDHKTSKPTNLV